MTRIDLENLDRERWPRIEAVLDEVIELSAEQRPAALDQLCEGDPALRSQVEEILAADSDAAHFLTTPVLEIAGDLLAGNPDSPAEGPGLEGKRVGPYRILREIGRGGMGRVYLAERVDGQFKQTVAIKLLKRGLDTDEILARFLQERQILARLEHPNIARLADGGATEEGLPWFALEFVEGTPITEFGPAYVGSPREMLRFFLQACRAVQYAHRNLVIHRDLKPSNILVSSGGEVKLLDFGIAKLLDPSGADPGLTAGPLRILTPIYASPEQVRGLPPTTATDVYALGVVLYEMITGERPYRLASGGTGEARRAILEEIPDRPSARLKRHRVSGPAPGREGWERAVRGDLDNIVEKAIRKEPEERYPTAEALAEDLERYLDGHPVRASGRRSAYVARKFIQRNRVGVAAAALLLLSLAGGLVATAWQARVAARERDRALLEAKKATEIKDFTLGLFSVSDPSESRGSSITARDLLERGTARANRELAGQPAVRAEMLTLLTHVYYSLGEFARAESLAQSSVRLARGSGGRGSEQLAPALHWLGITQRDQADFAEAKASLHEALAIRRASAGERSRVYAETLGELAGVYRQAGEPDSAEVCYRRALEIDRAVLGADHEKIATDLDNLGVLLSDVDKDSEALPLFRQAIAIRERKLGHMHPMTANAIANQAWALEELGRYPEAEALFTEAIRIRLRTLGPEHVDLAAAYANLAELKRQIGEYAEATPYYEKALAIERKTLGPDHPETARDVNNLAIVYYQRGLSTLALQRFQEALASRKKTLSPDNRGTLTVEHNIGCVLRAMGRYAESERILRDVRARRERTLGPYHIDVSTSDHHIGILLHLTGRDGEAERRLRRALAMRDSLAGGESPATAQTAEALATLLRDEGRYHESLSLYRRAAGINAKVFPQPSPQSAEALVGLGRLLFKMGKPAEAEGPLRISLAIRRRVLGAGEPRTAEAAVSLALCREALGAPAEAESLLAQALPVFRRQPGRVDPLVGEGARALDRIRRVSAGPS